MVLYYGTCTIEKNHFFVYTYRGHGDEGPPVGVHHGGEAGLLVVLALLEDVGQRGEDEHPHGEEEHEQPELLVGVLQGEAEALQADRVAGQLEDAEDAHDAEELRDPPDLGQLTDVRGVHQGDGGEVRKDGQQVDDVHQALDELDLARAGHKPDLGKSKFVLKLAKLREQAKKNILGVKCGKPKCFFFLIRKYTGNQSAPKIHKRYPLLMTHDELKGEPGHVDGLQ